MNFYNKDRKYRHMFRRSGRLKKAGMFPVLFLLFCVFVSLFFLNEPGFPTENTAQGEVDFSAGEKTAGHDEPVRVADAAGVSSGGNSPFIDKSAYFPDHTPAEGTITDGYGPRTDPEPSIHYAVDIASYFASPIYAAADGEVIFAGSDDIYGLNVIIDHIYDGYKTKYAHMCAYVVTVGEKVEKGRIIGFMGSTGYSTGVHLHYEVIKNDKRIDPAAFMKIKNGYAVTD